MDLSSARGAVVLLQDGKQRKIYQKETGARF